MEKLNSQDTFYSSQLFEGNNIYINIKPYIVVKY